MKAFYMGFLISIAITVNAQTFDADGNIIDSGVPRTPANPDVYEMQNRNAAVLSNMVKQNPQYWDGVGAATAYRKEREAYRQRREASEQAGGRTTAQASMGSRDRDEWENAQKDARSRFSSPTEKRNALETMRMIESRSNANVPSPPVEIHNHYEAPRRPLRCTPDYLGGVTCR
ncbi:MAG: hypothetical protein E6Q43_01235 [Dokdonella sp.]|jgi:hypothetical protein|nr:MAG: hypothetical protein E6Q43_01235 [Dokdonella sp.]